VTQRRLAPLAVLVAAALGVAACHEDIRFDDLSICATDQDCILPSLHCNSGTCVACTMDAHCTAPGYPRCDLALHRCVQCGVSADCGATGVCQVGRCMTPCTAGCPAAAPICDDSVCSECDDDNANGCTGSAAGPICFEHVCGACKDDTTCSGATPRCDPVTHACVQCRTNADCPAARPLCDVSVGGCAALP
jgi:hypothetical protein